MEHCQKCKRTIAESGVVGLLGGYTASLCVDCINAATQLLRPYGEDYYLAHSRVLHLDARSQGDGVDRFGEVEPLLRHIIQIERAAFTTTEKWLAE